MPADGPQNCDGNAVVFNDTEATLKLPTFVNGTNCVWHINATGNESLVIFVKSWQLGPGDSVKITDFPSKKDIYNIPAAAASAGLLFTNTKGNITITVAVNDTKASRDFDIFVTAKSQSSGIPITVSSPFRLEIPLSVVPVASDVPDPSVNLNLDTSVAGKAVVAIYDKLVFGKGNVVYENSKSPVPEKFESLDDHDADVLQDDISKPLVIKWSGLTVKQKDNGMIFTLDLVDKACSDYIKAEGTLSTPDGSKLRDFLKCLWLVDLSTTSIEFDYSKLAFFGEADTLTIGSGLNGYNSKAMVTISQSNVDAVKASLASSIVPCPARITFTSGYIDEQKKSVMMSLLYSKSNNSVYHMQSGVQVLPPLTNGSWYGVMVPTNQQAAIAFDGNSGVVADANFTFINTLNKNATPFMTVAKDQIMPNLIPSDTNSLLVMVSGTSNLKNVQLRTLDAQNIATVISGSSGAVHISGSLPCGATKSILIPSRANDSGIWTLTISTLQIQNQSDAFLIEQVDKTASNPALFSIRYKDAAAKMSALPAMILPVKYNYILKYIRGQTCNVGANDNLLEAAISYTPQVTCQSNMTLDTGVVKVVSTNYPEKYPLYHTEINQKCGYAAYNLNKFIYTVFHDLDLAGSQTLVFNVKGVQDIFTKDTKELPRDYIGENPQLMTLSSPLNVSLSDSQALSGRGFNVSLSSVDCGGYIQTDKNGAIITPGYPNTWANITSCIWILNVTQPNAHPVVNFTLDFDDKTSMVTIYDNPTSRDENRTITLSGIKPNVTFSSSVNTIVILYRLKGKTAAKGLQLNYSIESEFSNHFDRY